MGDKTLFVRPQMMRTVGTAVEQGRATVARLRKRVLGHEPTSTQLTEIAAILEQLAASTAWRESDIRLALPGEELLYPLSIADDGPSLYLVSDGVGITSAPHDHGTWAVIAGIRGREVNRLYSVTDTEHRLVHMSGLAVVGGGDTMILLPTSIHSTEVSGLEATFHLHLYGRPLHTLAPFESRRYTVAAA